VIGGHGVVLVDEAMTFDVIQYQKTFATGTFRFSHLILSILHHALQDVLARTVRVLLSFAYGNG
jgi:hypothetical protein